MDKIDDLLDEEVFKTINLESNFEIDESYIPSEEEIQEELDYYESVQLEEDKIWMKDVYKKEFESLKEYMKKYNDKLFELEVDTIVDKFINTCDEKSFTLIKILMRTLIDEMEETNETNKRLDIIIDTLIRVLANIDLEKNNK
ncbi:MAG: hypothetical protein ACLSXJ_01955 [Clostridium saudiense]|uniref:hypothetical protein n=1 Tax=Clostridium saudiense TaxID=1414720 RepID=UPI003996602D